MSPPPRCHPGRSRAAPCRARAHRAAAYHGAKRAMKKPSRPPGAWCGRMRSQPCGARADCRRSRFARRDRIEREVRPGGQTGARLRFALLGLEGTDAVDQPPAFPDPCGGARQKRGLQGRQGGDVGRPHIPQHVRMAAEGSGGRAGGVEEDGVEGARIGPVRGVGGDDLGGKAGAGEAGLDPAQAAGRAVQRRHLGAGGGELQSLAARRGAQVQRRLARLDVQQAGRNGGGRVLDPPAALRIA